VLQPWRMRDRDRLVRAVERAKRGEQVTVALGLKGASRQRLRNRTPALSTPRYSDEDNPITL
jgi:hypothetical protein